MKDRVEEIKRKTREYKGHYTGQGLVLVAKTDFEYLYSHIDKLTAENVELKDWLKTWKEGHAIAMTDNTKLRELLKEPRIGYARHLRGCMAGDGLTDCKCGWAKFNEELSELLGGRK